IRPSLTAASLPAQVNTVRGLRHTALITILFCAAGVVGASLIWRTGANGCALRAPALPSGAPASVESTAAQLPLGRVVNILRGRDPSTSMRFVSLGVASRVIEESFPIGVGYGNFRQHAVYPPEFAAYFQGLEQDSAYKSD